MVLPNQRFETNKINFLQLNNDETMFVQFGKQTPKFIGYNLISSRIINKYSAKRIASILGSNTSTISRYENGHFTLEHANLEFLKEYASACGKNQYCFLGAYLAFREFKDLILEGYLNGNEITKNELAKKLGVSKTLVCTWFNKKERCPSHELWQTAFKEFTLSWIHKNSDIFED